MRLQRSVLGILSAASLAGCGSDEHEALAPSPERQAICRNDSAQHSVLTKDLFQPLAGLVTDEKPLDFGPLPPLTYAYNPAILPWEGQILAIARVETYSSDGDRLHNQLAATLFDNQFNRVAAVNFLQSQTPPPASWTDEDPRLIRHADKIYLTYTRSLNGSWDGRRRVRLAELDIKHESRSVRIQLQRDRQLVFDGSDGFVVEEREKNWSPFSSGQDLCFLHRSSPMRVICLTPQDLAAPTGVLRPTQRAQHMHEMVWEWGNIRGGTPGFYLPEIDRFGTFYHSHAVMPVAGSEEARRHYFTGFMTFHTEWPYTVDRILPSPIITPFWRADAHTAEWHIQFVEGAVIASNAIWVSYGRNDRSSAVMRLDRKRLVELLEPVSWH